MPRSATVRSTRVEPTSETLSPAFTPDAIRPQAASSAAPANSAQVSGFQRVLHRQRSVRENLLQDCLSALDQIGDGNDLVHQPDPIGLRRADDFSRQDELQRTSLADQPWQTLCSAAARNDSQLDFRLSELRALRGHSNGAGHRSLAAAPEREPIDGRDHRLAQVLDEIEDLLSVRAGLFRLDGGDPGELADVGSGDERPVASSGPADTAHLSAMPR